MSDILRSNEMLAFPVKTLDTIPKTAASRTPFAAIRIGIKAAGALHFYAGSLVFVRCAGG